DLVSEFGGTIADYGMACSPLVVDGRVIVTVGAPQATVAALDGKTGKVAWTAGEEFPAGYSSPAILDIAAKKQVVVFHGAGGLSLDPATGKKLWDHAYQTNFNCNIATPLALDGGVFLSAGENHGSVLLSLTPRPDGTFKIGETWSSQGAKSVLRNEW